MTLKPILVKSAEYSDIQLGMTGELHLEDGTSFALRKYQHIILIDTEAEIVKDDLFVDTKTNVIHIASDSHVTWENEFKVISSTNKSHNLPQLSNESKQLLINYYNEHKCMPESIDVEEVSNGNWIPCKVHDGKLGEECTVCGEFIYCTDQECECGFKLKLNHQGEVDITIPEIKEKVYTEEEVWELCLRAYHLGGSEEHKPKVSITKWFSKNKK